MKRILLPLLGALVLLLTGCATTGTVSPPTPAQGAAAVRITVSLSATFSLANNPDYIPIAQALVAGIDGAVTDDATITPEAIARFVAAVCVRYDRPAKDAVIFTSLAQTAYTAYVATYRPQVVRATDPTVRLYVEAFKDGLADAIVANTTPHP